MPKWNGKTGLSEKHLKFAVKEPDLRRRKFILLVGNYWTGVMCTKCEKPALFYEGNRKWFYVVCEKCGRKGKVAMKVKA